MSNAPHNPEQSTLFIQTPTQLNPGAARPEDFPIEDRDGGQRGDTPAERAKLLSKAYEHDKSRLTAPSEIRNEVPHRRMDHNAGK